MSSQIWQCLRGSVWVEELVILWPVKTWSSLDPTPVIESKLRGFYKAESEWTYACPKFIASNFGLRRGTTGAVYRPSMWIQARLGSTITTSQAEWYFASE